MGGAQTSTSSRQFHFTAGLTYTIRYPEPGSTEPRNRRVNFRTIFQGHFETQTKRLSKHPGHFGKNGLEKYLFTRGFWVAFGLDIFVLSI